MMIAVDNLSYNFVGSPNFNKWIQEYVQPTFVKVSINTCITNGLKVYNKRKLKLIFEFAKCINNVVLLIFRLQILDMNIFV